jgi:hypothetical protein
MKDQKLKDYLKTLDKEQLESIIFNYYKFIVNKLEYTNKENKGFKEQNMTNLIDKTQDEIDFVTLELRWLENYLKMEV